MRDQLRAELAALRASALTSHGALAPRAREAIFARAGAPDDSARALTVATPGFEGVRDVAQLDAVIVKIARYAYRVTDGDIQGLLAGGMSAEAVYEAVICAALGAGYRRMERGLAALRSEAEPVAEAATVPAEEAE